MPSSSSDFFLSCSNRSPWWRLRIYVSHFSVVPVWALIKCYSSWNSCVVKVIRETMPDEDSGQDKGSRIISTCEFVPNTQNCRNQASFTLKTPPNMMVQWRVNTIYNAHSLLKLDLCISRQDLLYLVYILVHIRQMIWSETEVSLSAENFHDNHQEIVCIFRLH